MSMAQRHHAGAGLARSVPPPERCNRWSHEVGAGSFGGSPAQWCSSPPWPWQARSFYIPSIEGPAPAKLELPTTHASTSAPRATTSAASSSAVSGTWNVAPGSQSGYRVKEVLLGQSATAVGRTSKIWGSLTIGGTSVSKGSFTVDMASVVSDQSQRNAQFDGRTMDVNQSPTATLVLTAPIPWEPSRQPAPPSTTRRRAPSPCTARPRR